MKRILAAIVIGFLCFSMLPLLAPQTRADTTLRAWKDSSSLGLENDRLYLHGLAATGNFYWFFDYLVFKDTGTVWYQPWGELAIIVYPNYLAWYLSSTYEIHAFTEADRAYLTYSITRDNLREDITYTVYAGEPYINITFSTTNIGSSVKSTYVGAQFTTWIVGDHENDYFYVPGHGQGQFTGVGNVNFPDATETWVAMWDQSKSEGCGMLSTKGFTPINMITEDFGIGEGFKFISDNFELAPGQSLQTFDCYLYFFTGTGWQKTKDFYDQKLEGILQANVDIDPNTLNLRSRGKWITSYIELAEGHDVGLTTISSILLNNTVPVDLAAPTAIGDYDSDGIPDLMVKFDRTAVQRYILENVPIEAKFMTTVLTMTGKLNDGTLFHGSDTIKIIFPNDYWKSVCLE